MASPPIRITADEVNCLIYSYFKDSGFTHSAFTLCNEGLLRQSPYFSRHIPRGELIELLSKALLYLEVESHWRGDTMTTNCRNGFSLLEPHVCSIEPIPPDSGAATKLPDASTSTPHPVVPLQELSTNQAIPPSKELKELAISQQPVVEINSLSNSAISESSAQKHVSHTNGFLSPIDAGIKRKDSPIQIDGPAEKRAKREPENKEIDGTRQLNAYDASLSSTAVQNLIAAKTPAQMDKRTNAENGADPTKRKVRSRLSQGPVDDVTNPKAIMMLPGHRSEVFVCAFNPVNHRLIASGSKDAVVNIWTIPEPPLSKDEYATYEGTPISLNHYQKDVQGDLTALDWNAEGTLLAIGSYDSVLRICTSDGAIYLVNYQHKGPIFSVRFSRNGRWLLSASLDETACLWDVNEKRLIRQYRCHQDCCLDVEWLDDTTFASAGADGNIFVMKMDSPDPIKKLSGHSDEINQLKLDPSRTRLASCSDDMTTRIWRIDHLLADPDESIPGLEVSDQLVVLEGHGHSVSVVDWLSTKTQGSKELIASSSFDTTVRVWDAVTGECLKILADHKRPVYALAFSPDGKWLATGSGDGWLHIYSVKTWQQKWSWYAGHEKPGVFEISWQMDSGVNRIALALECKQVAIIDMTKIPPLQDTNSDAGDAS